MSSFNIDMPAPIDEDLAADVAKQAVYASSFVRTFRWDPQFRVARVEVEPEADAAEVEGKVRRFVLSMASRFRKLPKKVLQTSARRDRGAIETGVEEELTRRGFVRQLGPGQIALAGPPLAFLRALDARLAAAARTRFGAREEAYPALIPSQALHRCGYFASFPHSVSMVTHVEEDFDAIERFRAANKTAPALVIPDPAALSHPTTCLSPAVCYHLYPLLEGRALTRPVEVVTAMGRCFRYESKNMRGLERMWDFEMREVMFCGVEKGVVDLRQALMEFAAGEAAELDLDFTIESANDPFFSAAYAEKSYWQTRNDLKFELKLGIPPGDDGTPRQTAAASFNLHESFFGKTFTFMATDGQPAFTGCAAWGLERWVLAAFAQHGLQAARWPGAWRRDVFA